MEMSIDYLLEEYPLPLFNQAALDYDILDATERYKINIDDHELLGRAAKVGIKDFNHWDYLKRIEKLFKVGYKIADSGCTKGYGVFIKPAKIQNADLLQLTQVFKDKHQALHAQAVADHKNNLVSMLEQKYADDIAAIKAEKDAKMKAQFLSMIEANL